MAQPTRFGSFARFTLIFLVVYTLTNMVMTGLFPEQFGNQPAAQAVSLRMQDATVKEGNDPIAIIRNDVDKDLPLPQVCPEPPIEVYRLATGKDPERLIAGGVATDCGFPETVAARESLHLSLAPWKYSLFGELGDYELRLQTHEEGGIVATQFSIHEPGIITKVFRTFITKPLLNFLIFIASILPSYNLGWAIVILTVLVKILLFFPTQHALEGQRKMQAIQPKIEELRKKYKGDPQRLNQETMKLWKKEGINPMQSCLPMLLQFPVLIGLFFVIRDGSTLELSKHLIYSPYLNLDWTFGTQFLGLDLLKPSVYLLPPLLMVMQFLQMKLSFSIAKKKQKSNIVDVKKTKQPASMMETQQKVMLYGLPLMIGFFALQFPAAVSLYWGVSTVFAIGQQIVVNRKHL